MTLSKTLKFDTPVLEVLRSMLWSEDGTLGSIPFQLDRTLYASVNKALTAMGGKWNRSAGAHVFPTDPRPQVDGLLDTGALVVERDGFFETPEAVVMRMLNELPLPRTNANILEPSAGKGAILRVLTNQSLRPELQVYAYLFTAIERTLSAGSTWQNTSRAYPSRT